MEQPNSVTLFLAAFNTIENHFKTRLNVETSTFRGLADRYAEKFGLSRRDLQTLRMFADLRNFLVHNEYYQGLPIAQPVPGSVAGIQHLRDKILNPPTVLAILPRRTIVSFAPDDRVSSVLDEVRKDNYSQFPIYDGRNYCGLLTTNCISRWLADRLATDGIVESELVSEVVRFAEPQDHATHLPRTVTALQAIRRLSPPENGGPAPAALIITDSGKQHESPLAIVVAEDVAVLFKAI